MFLLQLTSSLIRSPLTLTKCTGCPAKIALHRLYSQAVPPRKRNWRLDGHVPPTSLIQEDQEQPTSLDLSEDEPPPPRRKQVNTAPTPDEWRLHRQKIKEAFPNGWNPTHKLSREAMDGLRSLHTFDNETFSCAVLAEKFKISPEAVRRILRSKWEPSREQRARLAERERRSREEWIAKNRLEENKKKVQVLLEARQNENENSVGGSSKLKPTRGSKRANSKDSFFFE
ncbi:hypothetical protein BDN67DRAFT_964998 [Paxillus ammoniavirescens]|nr:hypothetical protein BDN67DRAFT_964998 [Paxillus ammoniavirescens]